MSSHTIQGKVTRIYTANEDKGSFRYAYKIALISVSKVEKGAGISTGDLVYVKYWNKS